MSLVVKAEFFKIPNGFCDAFYLNNIDIALYRLLFVEDLPTCKDSVLESICSYKKEDSTTNRVYFNPRCWGYFYDLKARLALNKRETFLFVLSHIERNKKSVYFINNKENNE